MDAVILAGGVGTRLQPLTYFYPTCLVPLVNKAFIEYQLELLQKHGIGRVALSAGYMSDAVARHVGDGSKWDLRVKTVVEQETLGTAGGLRYTVKRAVNPMASEVIVICGDILTDLNLTEAIACHRALGGVATLVTVDDQGIDTVEIGSSQGRVAVGDGGRVVRFISRDDELTLEGTRQDEGDMEILAATGIYILNREVIGSFPSRQGLSLTDHMLPALIESGEDIYVARQNAYVLDIGTLKGYMQAHRDILDGVYKTVIEGKEIAPGVWAGRQHKVHKLSEITGPVVLGRNAYVGAHAQVRPYTVVGAKCSIDPETVVSESVILDNCWVAKGAVIEASIVQDGTLVGTNSHLKGAIIGAGSVIGAGTGNWLLPV